MPRGVVELCPMELLKKIGSVDWIELSQDDNQIVACCVHGEKPLNNSLNILITIDLRRTFLWN
jgi:hypothetical protein